MSMQLCLRQYVKIRLVSMKKQ